MDYKYRAIAACIQEVDRTYKSFRKKVRPVFSDITDGKFNEMLPDDFLKSLPGMDDCIAVAIYQTRKYYGASGENNGDSLRRL